MILLTAYTYPTGPDSHGSKFSTRPECGCLDLVKPTVIGYDVSNNVDRADDTAVRRSHVILVVRILGYRKVYKY